MSDPIWKLVALQNRDKQSSEYLNKDIPGRLLVDSAQCIIGTRKKLESGLLIIYDNDDYSQGYEQTNEASRALTKDEILKRYINRIMILDFQPLVLMMFDIIRLFLNKDIKQTWQLPSQLK